MADQTATFAIELEDGVSGPAQSAEAALEGLRQKIEADTRALRQMQQMMRGLNGATSVNVAAFRSLRDQIDAKKQSLAAAQAKFIQLGGVFGQTARGASEVQGKAGGMLDVLNALGGQTGETAGRFQQLSGAIGRAGFGGAAAIAVIAIVALAAAVLFVTVKLVSFAASLADAARSALLLNQAATGSARGAAELDNAVTSVGRKAAVARGDLESMARSLAQAGFSGGQLESVLSALAITTATLGDSAAAKLKETIVQLKKAGDERGLAKLLKETDEKLGKIAKQQMLSFGNQMRRAKENVSGLFSGLNVEPLLRALDSVLSLLDESTVTGRALKTIFTSLIQPLIDGVSKAAPLFKGFFKGLVIAALIFAIAVLKVKNAIRDAFDGSALEGLDLMKVGVYLGVAAFGALAAVIGTVIAIFAVLAAPFIAVGMAIYDLVGKLGELKDMFSQALDSIASLDVVSIGLDFVKGIAQGIADGASAVINAVTNLGDQAVGAIKAKLQIGSPSRLLRREVGREVPAGMVEGVEDGTADVESAMQGLVSIPSDVASKGGAAKSAGGIVVNIHVAPGGEEKVTDQSFLNMLGETLERALLAGRGRVEVAV